MIELGYMAKRIVTRPDWLDVPNVRDIYAVSDCISDDFCDYINFWVHNGFWFFNSPNVIQSLCTANQIDLTDTRLVYYRGYELQFDADARSWVSFVGDDHFDTSVSAPSSANLLGYDIVTYSMQNMPECSPLSCNHLATEVRVNEHCLIDSLDYAKDRLQNGVFEDSEPGPFRIIAVNSVDSPPDA